MRIEPRGHDKGGRNPEALEVYPAPSQPGGWSGGAMLLGKLPVLGILLIWNGVGQGPTALAVGAGGVVWAFFLSSIISLFFLPLSGRRPDID